MTGNRIATLLSLWLIFVAVLHVTDSYWLAALALAFGAGLAIADRTR